MKFQNKGAVLVQIAPLFISQPHSQNQSDRGVHFILTNTDGGRGSLKSVGLGVFLVQNGRFLVVPKFI